MDATVMPSAEICYIRHQKDKKVKTLVIWFKAELLLQSEATRERMRPFSDARLEECQNETEYLALKWRNARLAKLDVAVA